MGRRPQLREDEAERELEITNYRGDLAGYIEKYSLDYVSKRYYDDKIDISDVTKEYNQFLDYLFELGLGNMEQNFFDGFKKNKDEMEAWLNQKNGKNNGGENMTEENGTNGGNGDGEGPVEEQKKKGSCLKKLLLYGTLIVVGGVAIVATGLDNKIKDILR